MCLNQMKPHRSDSWSAGHVSLTSPRWLQEALEWLRCGAQRSTRMTIRERCHPAALKINVALEQFFLQGSCKEKWGVPESSSPVSPLLLPGLPLPRWAWGGTRRWLPRKPSAQRSHTSTSSRGARVRFPLRLLGFRAEQAVCGCEWYRVCAQRAPLTRPPGDPVRATLAAMDLGTEMVPFGAPHYQPTYPKNCLTCLYSKIILGSG